MNPLLFLELEFICVKFTFRVLPPSPGEYHPSSIPTPPNTVPVSPLPPPVPCVPFVPCIPCAPVEP